MKLLNLVIMYKSGDGKFHFNPTQELLDGWVEREGFTRVPKKNAANSPNNVFTPFQCLVTHNWLWSNINIITEGLLEVT